MEELLVGKSADSRRLRQRARLKSKLHFEQVGNQFLVRKTIADAYAGQTIHLRKRAQGNDIIVTIVHGVRVARVVLSVFEVGFVQNNEYALRYMAVDIVEFQPAENRSGWIIRIGQSR